jgi:hypothetical protein
MLLQICPLGASPHGEQALAAGVGQVSQKVAAALPGIFSR